jgi:sec-independent protein translocase protein TatA
VSSIGPTEIILLLVVALLLFGAKRLPEIGRSLGSGMREFKDSVSGDKPAISELPVATREVTAVAVPVAAVSVPALAPTTLHERDSVV